MAYWNDLVLLFFFKFSCISKMISKQKDKINIHICIKMTRKNTTGDCKARPRVDLIFKLSRHGFTLPYSTVLFPNYSG